MLRIMVLGEELYNEDTNEFVEIEPCALVLEHSLVSMSKWESIFCTPFLSAGEKSQEQILAYVRCMCLDDTVAASVFDRFSPDNFEAVNSYIESPQSATTFGLMPKPKGKNETITSELIYYWMVAFNIPFECQHWHLNRLFSLIRICNVKNEKPKKMSKHEIAMRNRQINAERRAQLNSAG